jgi:hypothetical protein
MDPTLETLQQIPMLRDIHDIPPIPWWPPAPGWWLIALGVLILTVGAWRWRARLSLRIPIPGVTLGSWRWDAAAALRDLRRRASKGQDIKQMVGELSELLRRIAMARLGRPACAGLTGTGWLDWLTRHDPNGFPWHERGRLLIDAPYAPSGALKSSASVKDLLSLIDATLAWVEVRDVPRRRLRTWRWMRGSARV